MTKHLTFAFALLTLISTSAHAQLPSYLPADGLVGWWPFNGNANDESGNGNDGVVNGAISIADHLDNPSSAYQFGSGRSVSVPMTSSLFQLPQRSFVCWFRANGPQGGGRIYETTFQNGGIGMYGGNTLDTWYSYSQHCCNIVGMNGGALGQWHHLVSIANDVSGLTQVFLDGSLLSQSDGYPVGGGCIINSAWPWQGQFMRFGLGASNESFNGDIDDIAIYNRALTEQEIQNLYTGTAPAACLDLPANLQDGLVGYWPFCGNANDESGNGNNGTVNGATLAEDRFGNAASAYSFDGVANHIDIPFSDLWRGNEVTVSAWIKKISDFNTQRLVIGQSNGRPQLVCNSDYTPGVDNAAFQFKRNSAAFTYVTGNSSILSEEWVNLIGVYTPGSIAIYVDGVLENSIMHNDLFDDCSQTPLQVGAFNTNGNCGDAIGITQAFFGLIDDITIYNRALSPEEVTQLYAVQSTGDPTAGGGGTTTGPLANVPRGISYQAVARDAQGQAIASSPVNVRFTLHQGTPTGTTEYSETHALATNEIGLFSTYFGSGTAITSAFDSIVWSNTTKFLQVEIDLGNGYVDMGTQQLMSVPYAYRANEAAAAGTIRNNALPVYANNAAALAGGLAVGEMYRTAMGDLKVVY